MSIFRVNIEKGFAKSIPSLRNDAPELHKHYKNYEKSHDQLHDAIEEWFRSGEQFRKTASKILADSRKGYTLADKALKELQKAKSSDSAAKDKIKLATSVRKYYYDTGNFAKEFIKMSKQ